MTWWGYAFCCLARLINKNDHFLRTPPSCWSSLHHIADLPGKQTSHDDHLDQSIQVTFLRKLEILDIDADGLCWCGVIFVGTYFISPKSFFGTNEIVSEKHVILYTMLSTSLQSAHGAWICQRYHKEIWSEYLDFQDQ